MSNHEARPEGDEFPNETSDEEWGLPGHGIPPLKLEEQLAIERERRQQAKEAATEGPELGFSLERQPDPRESDEWFTRMDENTRSQIKKDWRLESWLHDAVQMAWHDRRRQAYIDSLLIFFLSQTLFDPFRISLLKIVGVLPIALLVGWLWGRFKMDRMQSIGVGFPFYLAYQLVTGLDIFGIGGFGGPLTLFYGSLAFCCLAGMAGLMRESAT